MIAPARIAAFNALLELERHGGHAEELLRPRLEPLADADRRLGTEIVMGVLRWRSALDAVLGGHSSKPLAKLDPEVLTALRMAAYQLAWLDRVPASAAVNDSVALVKRARKSSAAPFVNAVLRKTAAEVEPQGRAMREPATADQSAAALARAYAHPEWLVGRWIAEFGPETARALCSYDQQVPPTALRLGDPAAAAELARQGIELAPGALLSSARRVVHGDVSRTAALREGRVHIQDEASQLVALLVGRGERILDCCAAPGGKTAAIAARNPGARIVAAEANPKRAEALRTRLSGHRAEVVTADARFLPPGRFDRVLADVPCSGTGTLARHPEIKWRLRPEDFADYQQRQRAILGAALDHLDAGGRLIYSTCSLEKEEDEDVVAAALAARNDVRVLDMKDLLLELCTEGELVYPDADALARGPFLRTLPGVHPCDGFFAAALVRI